MAVALHQLIGRLGGAPRVIVHGSRLTCGQRRALPQPRVALASVPRRAGPRGRAGVQCRSDAGTQLNAVTVISALAKASSAWEKYDKDRSGTLTLKECEEIFNSPEITEAVELLTNVERSYYTAADLKPFFERADADHSGTLSRTEFLALYLAVATERVKRNPLLLAEALLGYLDKDKNGVLEGGELKALLAILGFPAMLLLPIPPFLRIEYKAILHQLGGRLENGTHG